MARWLLLPRRMRTTRACLVSFALFAWSCGNAKLVVDGGGEGPDALDDDSYGITYYVPGDGGDPDQSDRPTDAASPGAGAPGAGACDPIGAWDCVTPAVPSGPDAAHPTRIVGAGYQDGCAEPPE